MRQSYRSIWESPASDVWGIRTSILSLFDPLYQKNPGDPFLLLIIALVCFLVSVIIDTFFEFSGFMAFAEDVFTFTGSVSWLANRDTVIMNCSNPNREVCGNEQLILWAGVCGGRRC
jgi:hypothetical protein